MKTNSITIAELRMAQQTYGYWVQQKIEAEKKIAALAEFLESVTVQTDTVGEVTGTE